MGKVLHVVQGPVLGSLHRDFLPVLSGTTQHVWPRGCQHSSSMAANSNLHCWAVSTQLSHRFNAHPAGKEIRGPPILGKWSV